MKDYWENIYASKKDAEVSWYQENPLTSLSLINKYSSNKNIEVIDVGGGSSNLVIALFKDHFKSLSVLDVSQNALKRTAEKLGGNAAKIQWIDTNVLDFNIEMKYNIWHDRAVFHFLTTKESVQKYKEVLVKHLKKGDYFLLATFSKEGPLKCSGLDITQYNIEELKLIFQDEFNPVESFFEDHNTPFDTIQNFIYSVWQKK